MATKREERMAASAAATAEANARAAEAQARALEAQLAAGAAKRKSDTFVRDAAVSAGINVGLPAMGIYGGAKIAKLIGARHERHIRANNKEMAGLAAKALPIMRGVVPKKVSVNAALAGIVASADKLKLSRARGPLGLAYAGLLMAEGAMSRYVVAPAVKDETSREALTAVGTASAFAATTLIGKRVIDNATMKVVPNAANLAVIGAARSKLLSTAAGAKALAAAAPAMTVGRLALRALPVISYASMAVGAGINAYSSYRDGGTMRDIAISALKGTIGLGHTTAQAGETRLASTRALIARNAQFVQRSARRAAARASAPTSDGMTKSYVRQQAGKQVTVKSYQTPKR